MREVDIDYVHMLKYYVIYIRNMSICRVHHLQDRTIPTNTKE